jgi:hypothetical protein
MESTAATISAPTDILFLALVIALVVCVSLAVFLACFYWFRREQRRWQKNVLRAIADSGRDPEELFLTGRDAITYGELIAQFKVNQGKQVISVLESDGKLHSCRRRTVAERTHENGALS